MSELDEIYRSQYRSKVLCGLGEIKTLIMSVDCRLCAGKMEIIERQNKELETLRAELKEKE